MSNGLAICLIQLHHAAPRASGSRPALNHRPPAPPEPPRFHVIHSPTPTSSRLEPSPDNRLTPRSASGSTPRFTRAAWVIFTDLDGTLLDHDTYSWTAAVPGMELLRQAHLPLVFCSAKTRLEQQVYRQALHVHDPFIVENGGAILIEPNYFLHPPTQAKARDGLLTLELGRPRATIRRAVRRARTELGLEWQGYGDLRPIEIASLTGLDLAAARRARKREYEETIVTPLHPSQRQRISAWLAKQGLHLTRGARFHAVSAGNDKGRAVRTLMELYRAEHPGIRAVGIGDSWNDRSLLESVDLPLLVQRPDRRWEPLHAPGLVRIPQVGPAGWTEAVRQLVTGRL
jgi:mannosyl-3-phosphoglycerate phosphatase